MDVKTKSNRLFFIDAIRAWAILMMLQGHFVDGLLDPIYRDPNNLVYKTWLYFRGITAPVFFTVSGFIFTYLLTRVPQVGYDNPRVMKGIRRGLQLLLIGYLLRLNVFGLFKGQVYGGFFLVDVLHCIGLSILSIIGLYLLTVKRHKIIFPLSLVMVTLMLFLFEPIYKQASLSFLPQAVANYFTKANGSVFTIFPWLGYTTIGAALALVFHRYKNVKLFYPIAITTSLLIGYLLIFKSSLLFLNFSAETNIQLFKMIQENNYLFIRLGDVFIVFAVFMIIRKLLTNRVFLQIGSSTLTIYIVHFIVLYGTFTGLGLYRFFHHELNPTFVIPGAVAFMVVCTYISLQYLKHEETIKSQIIAVIETGAQQVTVTYKLSRPLLKEVRLRAKLLINRVLGLKRG